MRQEVSEVKQINEVEEIDTVTLGLIDDWLGDSTFKKMAPTAAGTRSSQT